MAMKDDQIANYLKSALHGLKLKHSKEFNIMIKEILGTEIQQLEQHIRELETKKKGA